MGTLRMMNVASTIPPESNASESCMMQCYLRRGGFQEHVSTLSNMTHLKASALHGRTLIQDLRAHSLATWIVFAPCNAPIKLELETYAGDREGCRIRLFI